MIGLRNTKKQCAAAAMTAISICWGAPAGDSNAQEPGRQASNAVGPPASALELLGPGRGGFPPQFLDAIAAALASVSDDAGLHALKDARDRY